MFRPDSRAAQRLNQETGGGADGNRNLAALGGGNAGDRTARQGPTIQSPWPVVENPPGCGELEVRSFSNAQGTSSGYPSTVGPGVGWVR